MGGSTNTILHLLAAAQEAELEIEEGPVVVKCQECGGRSVVPINRLLCTYCGEWKVAQRMSMAIHAAFLALDPG